MISGGIEVPEELEDEVEVYYSVEENPSRDINKGKNKWKTVERSKFYS